MSTTEAFERAAEICPRCEKNWFTPYQVPRQDGDPSRPSMSRVADVDICEACGMAEAMTDHLGKPLPGPADWPLPEPNGGGQ